jgi:hypothetical protein
MHNESPCCYVSSQENFKMTRESNLTHLDPNTGLCALFLKKTTMKKNSSSSPNAGISDTVHIFALLTPYRVYLFASIILFTLSGCVLGRTMVNHSFTFDTIRDSSDGKHPETEILDYQYGSSGQFGTFANKEAIKLGMTFKQDRIRGSMPRGEFLYVKWRDISSGQIFEDKVDLRSRLPDDIEHLDFHFVVKGPQLYVFF